RGVAGPAGLGAAPKRRPRTAGASLADAIADILAAATGADDLEVDEDVEAMAALEELPSGELQRLRLRYLKERRQAALRAGPIGREDLLRCEADIAELLAETRRARPWPVRVQAAADAVKAAGLPPHGLRGVQVDDGGPRGGAVGR
ncbi:MAG: hypothetical protein ACKPKO_18110, partial [Candidatus Fonsibacter sp.]